MAEDALQPSVRAHRGFFPIVSGLDVDVSQAGSQLIAAGNVLRLQQGGGNVLAAGNRLEVEQGGGLLLAAPNVSVRDGWVGMVVGNDVRLDGTKIATTTPAALGVAVLVGLVVGWLLGRRTRRGAEEQQ